MRPSNVSITSSIIKPPCTKDCENRVVGCHGTCNKYKNYVEEKERLKKDIAEQSKKDADFIRYRNDIYKRIARSH